VRAQSALFTLFGDVVRPSGGEAWLSALIDAMGALGFTPEATRTALSRMAAEGWVEPRRAGRYAAYRLTGKGVDRLEEAAARIYRLRATAWDGRWRLLILDATDEVARRLAWTGYGRLPGGVWVSPHDHQVGEGLAFCSTTEDDRRIVTEAWDLSALRAAHEGFLARWGAPDGLPPQPEAAFVERIRLVHDWRSFLFLDPGLPTALLPADWLGETAAARFHDRYEWVSGAAWAWWSERQATAPAVLTGAA
jgi:phenylacetic acid degradation operon negative regulatory protein